jgi:hypothetical protein
MNDDREHDDRYEAAARALAASVEMAPQAAARIESELQRAFAKHHTAAALSATVPAERERWRRRWFAAAAALILVAAGMGIWRHGRDVTENSVTVISRQPSVAAPSQRVSAETARTVDPAAVMPGARPSVRAAKGRRAAPVLRPSGFVPLPEAAGLPPFESGAIVRVEVPVGSLPAYGVDISPASDGQPVEADLLVGQDGQARAIRVVTNSSRSTQ